ncbi:MAG TPA: peptidylprolyl isomerase, partial [Candidatus Brocadiaceae bacterium]|nr:peptidylprolyl isomerase [Candidatus Brocadiaceae bacterium]
MKTYVCVTLFAVTISAGLFFNQTIFGEVENTTKPIKDEPKIITDKNIVAIVNGQKITRQELYNLLTDTYGEDALDVLIRRTLIYQTAQKENISVSNSEIELKLKTIVNNEIDASMQAYRIKDRKDFENELAKNGISLAQVEEKISKKMRKQAELEILTEKIIAKTITLTEEELQKAYDQVYGEKIEASQIVFKTRREAEDVLKKLKSGADFATLAKNESIDRASAIRGGKMLPFSPKDGIGAQIAHLKVGELSDIIKTDYGYHIIKISDKKAASNKSFKS